MSESKTYEDENGYLRFKDSHKYVHIWVMRKKINRPLKKGEIVHHVNGNKKDNSDSNLIVLNKEQHYKLHVKPLMDARLESEIEERLTPIIEERLAPIIEERLTLIHEAKFLKTFLISFAWGGAVLLIAGIIISLVLGKVATVPLWTMGMGFLVASLLGVFLQRRNEKNESDES